MMKSSKKFKKKLEAKDAVAAIIIKDDKLLLIERAPGQRAEGYWCPVTGSVEPNETQAEALVREVREEVGLDATACEKVWECPIVNGEFILHWWTASINGTKVVPQKSEVSGFIWATVDDIKTLNPMFEEDRNFIIDFMTKHQKELFNEYINNR